MRRVLPLAVLATALAAYALPIDRGIVEDGTDSNAANGTTDGGVTLVRANGTTRLRPATCTSGVCTRAAPDAGAEGLDMEDVAACRLLVCAPGTQRLTATGQLEAWCRDPTIGRWGHLHAKTLDISVQETCQAFPVELNGMQGAGVRLLYRANGIGVTGSDGGSLITSFQCCKRSGVPLGSTGYPGCGP